MKHRYLLLIGFAVLVTGGVLLFLKSSHTSKQLKQATTHPAALPKEETIMLDKNGFSPKSITVKVGTAVRWKNVSGDKQTVNSDNYPTNQLHKELNFGIVSSGSSVVYIFKTPGIYGYHNQFHPEEKGTIVVTK